MPCSPVIGTFVGAGVGLYLSGILAVRAYTANDSIESTVINQFVSSSSAFQPGMQLIAFTVPAASWVRPVGIGLTLLGAWLGHRLTSCHE